MPNIIRQIVYSDYFLKQLSNALEDIWNDKKNHSLEIFNKFKASSYTSFDEYAFLSQTLTEFSVIKYFNSIFENPFVLISYILDELLQNTVCHNINNVLDGSREWNVLFCNDLIKISKI